MHTLEFKPVDLESERAVVTALQIEYLNWVSHGVSAALGQSVEDWVGMSIADYVSQTLDRVCGARAPRGVFYLVRTHGDLAAMVGLSHLRDDVAEVKRLYVRPEYRGRRFGQACLRRVLQDAGDFGYLRAVLDTAPFMYSAIRLYRRCGFEPCPPYPDAEIPAALQPSWVFMCCDLAELPQVN